MNWYTADLHFGRQSTFEKEKRNINPMFRDTNGNITLEQYGEVIVDNINREVSKSDTLYIVGDVGSMSYCPIRELQRIKCKKILIIGNHDRRWLNNRKFTECFEEILPIKTVKDDGENIVLCHYPMADWERSQEGWWHLYGHIHEQPDIAARQFMQTLSHTYHVGVDSNGYMPLTMEEIKNRRKTNET